MLSVFTAGSGADELSAGTVILIGMPGVGKTTLGATLATSLGCEFIDTDLLIEQAEQQSLQAIVDQRGYLQLREIEERILLALDCEDSVVATGGSAVYSVAAMAHLKRLGTVIYLRASLATLQRRIDNFESRGLARSPGQSLASLFAERGPLYERYADRVLDCESDRVEQSRVKLEALLAAQ